MVGSNITSRPACYAITSWGVPSLPSCRTQGPPPPSPVAEAAAKRGIPQDLIFTPEKARDEEFLQALKARRKRARPEGKCRLTLEAAQVCPAQGAWSRLDVSFKAHSPSSRPRLQALEPDVCITAAYGNVLPEAFLSIPKHGTVNIHPSLLPAYRGAAPVQRALEAGEKVTGVTVAFTVRAMARGRCGE